MEREMQQTNTDEKRKEQILKEDILLAIALPRPGVYKKGIMGGVMSFCYIMINSTYLRIREDVRSILLPILVAFTYSVSLVVYESLSFMYREKLRELKGEGRYIHIQKKGTLVLWRDCFGGVVTEKRVKHVKIGELTEKESDRFYKDVKRLVLVHEDDFVEEIPIIEKE